MANQHPLIDKDGWFREMNDHAFPGQALALKVDKILYTARSEFQDILLFKSTHYGNVLVLDGIIQVTERDEFAYQEMISHIPLFAHKNPRRVLVIGGGDGGVLREVVKHSCVENVTLVEIDETVIKLSKEYLPNMSCAFNHPKVRVEICDGFQYLKDASVSEDKFDVIITDSSDPEGPAEAFFQKSYFELLHNALNDDGVVIAQASENVWLNIEYLKNLLQTTRSVFANSHYLYTAMPTYTSGQLGLIISSKASSIDLKRPCREVDIQDDLRYYNEQVHSAAFVVPNWAKRILN